MDAPAPLAKLVDHQPRCQGRLVPAAGPATVPPADPAVVIATGSIIVCLGRPYAVRLSERAAQRGMSRRATGVVREVLLK